MATYTADMDRLSAGAAIRQLQLIDEANVRYVHGGWQTITSGLLKELQGKETVQRWQAWARASELAPLFEELMVQHYDPHYARSQARHFVAWSDRCRIDTSDLSEQGVEALAEAVLALDADPAAFTRGSMPPGSRPHPRAGG